MGSSLKKGLKVGEFELVDTLGGTALWRAVRGEEERVLKPLYWVTPQLGPQEPWHSLDAPALPELDIPGLCSFELLNAPVDGITTWLVMPLVEGEPLSKRVSGGAMAREEALMLVRLLCRTLEALHSRNLFHNALCAENVFVAEGQVPTLVSFGQPEALSTPDERNGRWDLFCLGTLLGELLTGRFGFDGDQRPATSDDSHGFHRRERSVVQFPHIQDIEDRVLRSLVIDLTCSTSGDYITNVRDLGERIDGILEGDHRMRDLETDFGDVKQELDLKSGELDRRFQDLKVAQEQALAVARAELEVVKQELEEEKKALVATREAIDDRVGRLEKVGIGLVAMGLTAAALLNVLDGLPLVNNSELDVAYAVQEEARWQDEVVSRSTLCAWMADAEVVQDAASCQTKLKPTKAP